MASATQQRRSERSRQAILAAALEVCQEGGYQELSIEAIARRAGAGKQTIYRWWPSKAAVLLEALRESLEATVEFADSGDVVADMQVQMAAVARALADPDRSAPYRGLIAAGQTDAEVAKGLFDIIIEPRRDNARRRLEIARQRGQLGAGEDLDLLIELLYGPLYYRLLVTHQPLTEQHAAALVDRVLANRPPSGAA